MRSRALEVEAQLRRSAPWEGPVTITLVVGAGVVIPGGITSVVALVSAVQTTTAPSTHFFFPCLEHGAVSVMCGKLGVEERKNVCKGGGAPTEAVVRRAAVTTTAAVLYTRLPAGVLSANRRPQG